MNPTTQNNLRAWLVSLLCIPMCAFASIQHTVTFATDQMTITPDTIDGSVFYRLKYGDLINANIPGEPSLPVKYMTFSIPYDAYNISVTATCGSTSTYRLSSQVYPGQQTEHFSDYQEPAFTGPNDSIYNSANNYPASVATIASEGFYDGENHIVTIAVNPMIYTPSQNKVTLNRSINLTIQYDSGDGIEPLAIKPLLKYTTATRNTAFEHLNGIVENPSQVAEFVAPLAISTYSVEPLPYYEYCVITSRELAPAFERLVAWQLHKGLDAGIVCTEDILACEDYQNGDPISGINSDAGKLRAYLMDASAMGGTKYVLLGGKEPHVPVMKEYYFKFGTDLYFADLNGNWDCNKDGEYIGSFYYDKVDFATDIKLGRLSCKNTSEVENYIDKYLTYERNPPQDSTFYNRRFINFQKPIFSSYPQHFATVIDAMHVSQVAFDSNTPELTTTGADIISLMNGSKYGMTFLNGHGNEGSIMVSNYGINALDNERHYVPDETGNGLDNLTNKDYPGIMYAMACQTIPYMNTDTLFSWNFGESYTLGKDYGGVAYLGFNDIIFISEGCPLETYFIKSLNQYSNLYDAFSESRRLYSSESYSRMDYNFLGDPTIRIWSKMPFRATASDFEAIRDAGDLLNISVLNSYADTFFVSIRQPDGTAFRQTIAYGANISASSNSSVMFYNDDMTPYIAPLIVQDQTYNKSQYIFASSVHMGRNVNLNMLEGDVIIASGIDITIDASEDVCLGPGFIVNSGASITIISQGTVTLDGCTVKSGGSIIIKSPKTEITDDFILQQNADIEIYKLN